jgi:hypothetical protein
VTTSRPIAGANVQNGSSNAVSDANGAATLTAPAAGFFRLYAWRAGAIPTNQPVVNTVAPPPPVQPPNPPAAPSPPPAPPSHEAPLTPESAPVTIDDPPVDEAAESRADARAIFARITGIRDRQHFRRGKGPRTLRVSVTHGGLVKSVELRLRRKTGRACSGFNGRTGRFNRVRCSHAAPWFYIGSKTGWSHQLRSRLPKGLYRIEVRATNDAGHHAPVHGLHFRVR